MRINKAFDLFVVATAAILTVILLLLPHLDRHMAMQTVAVATSNKPTVVLDPGHGGFDGGAQSNGVNEKEINLAIAEKERLLCELFGFNVVMTRDSDVSIHDEGNSSVRSMKRSDLHKRLGIMTANPSSVAVSIHMNKFPQAYVHGAQVFYSPKSKDSDVLAQTIQDNFRLLLQPDNKRTIKKADKDLFILYNNDITPAVIVECGFISNADEAQKLTTTNYQEQIAMTICYSLMKFQNREESEVTEVAS
ncbi:MAG: N-acetylmuramoyl-L-alanine amidase [Angelakisella sp.]